MSCLSEDLFNTLNLLSVLTCPEFMESMLYPGSSVHLRICWYDEAGQLTEKIRRRPYSVVLFDEIEKAHPDVLNILLQILDDGHITDAHGREVNFENTVIVMTSNAGSGLKGSAPLGFGHTLTEQTRERSLKALSDIMRPEFINRVDEIIAFNQLTKEDFKKIAGIMLGDLKSNLAERDLFKGDEVNTS